MADPESARAYLLASLPHREWTTISRALRRNPAYIQQYIRRGKPKWLSEDDRRILVRMYDLDPTKLRPPAKTAAPPRPRPVRERRKQMIDADLARILENSPGAPELLRTYTRMQPRDQRALLRLVGSVWDADAERFDSGSTAA